MFDMPAPLGNRFLHPEVLPDFESFRIYALENSLSEQVLAFLSYRPTLLHKLDSQRPAWPFGRLSLTLDVGIDGRPARVDGAGSPWGVCGRRA